MKGKIKAMARASSTISVNGNIIDDTEMIMGTDGKKGKILTRDMNTIKYIDLTRQDMENILSKRANKKSLEQNLEEMLNKQKKLKKRKTKKRKKGRPRGKGKRKTKKR
jgi:hypothetical protein